MRAWIYRRYGGPEVLQLADIGKPSPGRGEVRLEVLAFALNPLDWKLRSGQFRILARGGLPRGVGYDVAGIVDEAGPGLDLSVGDLVVGMINPYLSKLGAASDYTCVQARHAVRIPSSMDPAHAAALPGSGMTALQALRKAGARAGQRALIAGASGGVGSFAVLLAKLEGLHVTAAASAAGQAHLATLAPDVMIDTSREDWRSIAKRFDLVFDCTGASTFAQCRHQLEDAGVYANVLPNGAMYRAAFVAWLTSRQRVVPVMERPSREDLAQLVAHVTEGRLRAPVTRVGSMEDVPELERELEAGRGRGKFVVRLQRSAAS